jgi:hypothetical protein
MARCSHMEHLTRSRLLSSPATIAMPLPKCRRFVCSCCHAVVYICQQCDRNHRYCGKDCAGDARQESLLAAGDRYQSTFAGRLHHAARQAVYAARRKLTHQTSPPEESSFTVEIIETEAATPPPASGSPCEALDSTPALVPPEVDDVKPHPATHAETPLAGPPPSYGDFVRCTICGCACDPHAREGTLKGRPWRGTRTDGRLPWRWSGAVGSAGP